MLKPGATVGILGGGQLGRMLALAAAPLGLKVHVYAPEAESPAFEVAGRHTVATYENEAALAAFASAVDVVTTEFENVPAATAAALAARVPVRPNPKALAIAQDRWLEKSFLKDIGAPVHPFVAVDDAASLAAAGVAVGFPFVLKTRRLGYDGKGQAVVRAANEAEAAWDRLGRAPAIAEAFVPFTAEVSIVAARGVGGEVAAYDMTENRHADHILDRSIVPCTLPGAHALDQAAREIATRIAERLDYVGVFAVEFFVTAAGGLLVNEIAPRVHNSGHWTIEGAETSQFEQQIRAVAGWPLGLTQRRFERVEMTNLIGAQAADWAALAAEPGAHLHLYGKAETRPGRKMGHVTRCFRG